MNRCVGKERNSKRQAKSQKILLEDARNSVIVRTASTYLELAMGAPFARVAAQGAGEPDKNPGRYAAA